MPLQKCTLKGAPGWQYGASGTCYAYETGDKEGMNAAKKKAIKQAIAENQGKAPADLSASEPVLLAEVLAEDKGIMPLRLGDAVIKAGDVTPVLLFPIGQWKSAKYAAKYPKGLPLTRETADLMVANFEANTLGIDVQFSVAGAHGLPDSAAFWVQGLKVAPYSWQGHEGDALWADVKWTQAGADKANGDEYKYVSIEAGDFLTPTGETVPWVLQGGVLTNYPVIKIMPPIREASDAIAAADEPRVPMVEISLGDLEEEAAPTILDTLDALAASAHARVSIALVDDSYNDKRRTLEAVIKATSGRGCWVEDFSDNWVVFTTYNDGVVSSQTYRADYSDDGTAITMGTAIEVEPRTTYVPKASLPGLSPSGSATGEQVAGSAATGGVSGRLNLSKESSMSKLTELLKLDESAPDELILAEVTKTASERDLALAEVAKRDKAERARKLDEAITAVAVAPREKDFLLGLAESTPEAFDAILESRKGLKLVDLEEHGSAKEGPEDTGKNPSVELAEKVKAYRAANPKTGWSEAQGIVLADTANAGLRERYDDYRAGKEG